MSANDDIEHYFDTRRASYLEQYSSLDGYLGKQLFQTPKFPNLSGADVAIIGIDETRGSEHFAFESKPDKIRYWLYQLVSFDNLNIVDLGNMITGLALSDTYKAIENITEFLVSKGIIPVFIGGSHDLTIPMVEGVLQTQRSIEYAVIDSRVDIQNNKTTTSRSFIGNLLNIPPSKCMGNIIAHQSYFTPNNYIAYLQENNTICYRLGILRNNIAAMEPVLRDCEVVTFDASSVRQADMPKATMLSPNGLYTEEACQLSSYAGRSDRAKAFGFFELADDTSTDGMSSHLAAQIIWHYLSGVSLREKDYPIADLSIYKKIFVKSDDTETDFVFYQNEKNGRFWLEIPQKNKKDSVIVSCSVFDYKSLINKEIPDRIRYSLQKYGI